MLSAPKILDMGAPGSGKTSALATLLKNGVSVFMIATEPGAPDAVIDRAREIGADLNKLHWRYVKPMSAGLAALTDMAKQINMQTYQSLADNKAGIMKQEQKQAMEFLKVLEDFKDERTGQSFGSPFSWGTDRCLAVDSLSGLNLICQQNTVGLKPTMAPGEWNVAMTFEEAIINKMTSDLLCWFVLLAHIDRNLNEVSQQTVVTPAALGSKLGPRLGKFFGEVILSKRDGATFLWSTSERSADVKNRLLPISDKLQPDYGLLVQKFEARLKSVGAASLPAPAVASVKS
jgi:hypothetical protein